MPQARKGNGFDPTLTKRFVSEIERHKETIASYTGEHMQRCQGVREMISEVFDRAKDAGLPKKELKAVIKARDLEAKAKAARDDLDDMERQETFDQIRLALGDLSDLPLGQAAVETEEKKRTRKKTAKALDEIAGDAAAEGETEGEEADLRPAFLKRGGASAPAQP